MTRFPQSDNTAVSLSDLLADQGSDLGSLLRRADLLAQLQQLLAGSLDPALAARFQVANIRQSRLVLLAPSAAWATRLRMQAPQLLKALHGAGFPQVERVDVRIDVSSGLGAAPLAGRPTDKPRSKEMSPAARQAFDRMSRLWDKDEG
jgi:hypothetical protein